MKKSMRKILEWQILFVILVLLALFGVQRNWVDILNAVFLFLSFVFVYKDMKILSHVFNVLLLPYIFLHSYCRALSLLLGLFVDFRMVLYILYFAGMLVLLIPTIIYDYGSIKKTVLQLAATIWLIISLFLVSFSLVSVNGNQFIVGLSQSNLLLALIFLEYGFLVTTSWGYRFYFNLKVKEVTLKYYLLLLILIGITLWLSLFNTFILSASYWSQAFFNWDFSLINSNESALTKNIWHLRFSALDAGIMEESARYIFLLLLLVVFSKKKGRILYSIICSSAIFSTLHILSFSTTGATVNSVIFKILHAFGFGCLLGIILLFSGKLWLTIGLHIFADYLNYSLISLGYGGSIMDDKISVILFLCIITIIPVVMVVLVLWNKSAKAIINKNIKKILNFNI